MNYAYAGLTTLKTVSLKMGNALEYSVRMVQEGDQREGMGLLEYRPMSSLRGIYNS
jgi:hypothetical protein